MRHSLSRNMRLARATAPPDITMLREAKVPKPKAVLSVSPWRTEIRAGSMPSSWAATCDSAVSSPWPCDWMPTISTTLPSVRMRAVQLSKPGMIDGAAGGEFGRAVRGLLGKAGKADADQPAVRLAAAAAARGSPAYRAVRRTAARSAA